MNLRVKIIDDEDGLSYKASHNIIVDTGIRSYEKINLTNYSLPVWG